MAGSIARDVTSPFTTPMHIDDLTVADLTVLCKARNLKLSGNKADLKLRVQKYDKQARVYDGLTTLQLLKEVRTRKLAFPPTATKATLIALLETADTSRAFPRFLDLPAELRNRIYRFATCWDPTTALVRPRAPALCQASKQLRHESLPIFYGVNSFAISLCAAVYRYKPQHRPKLGLEARLDHRDGRWLGRLEGMSTARYLSRVVLVVGRSVPRRGVVHTCTEVEFTKGVKKFEVRDLGVWEGDRSSLVGIGRVGGEDEGKWRVGVPRELGEVLGDVVKSGESMSAGAVQGVVECFLKGSRHNAQF